MNYDNFKTYPISKSPLQKYLDMFNIKLDSLNFKELYFIEKNNLSIYKNDNPVLMRAILEK